ncbi:hypothetical protein ACQKKX_00420 [Neorhizobium sp. NPDC001467]|uniref:hypothetical protein n=1 Tax=Neorhizobium sp. NPDC001467 TaxID=3390595 RepID=UPI003D05175D
MGGLAPIVASLLAVDIHAFTKRLRRNAVLYAIAGFFMLTAYAAGVTAFGIYLATMMHPAVAAAVVAFAAFIVALIFFAAVMLANRAEEKRKRQAAAANSGKAMMVTAAITALPMVIRSRPLAAVAIAGGLAMVLGRTFTGGSHTGEDA